jgi:DNA-binding response OmpR family regulator
VEDHDDLREVTVEALSSQGHHVVGVDCAEALTHMGHAMQIDLMVVDLNLPGEDGLSLARRIRLSQPDIGIIMATARGQAAERTKGYESGADIYLTKPASVGELRAAIRALSRRIKRSPVRASAQNLDLNRRSLSGKAGEVGLTLHEATLLAALLRAPGYRLESWQLIESLGKTETGYSKASLEVQIVRLRKKLVQAGAAEQPIKAIHQWGYQLCVEIQAI